MIVGEAEDVALLQREVDLVLLAVPGPYLTTRGHCPAGLIQAEVSVEVSSWGTYTSTPYSSLLDFHLQQWGLKKTYPKELQKFPKHVSHLQKQFWAYDL